MSDHDTTEVQGTDTELDARDVRALTEYMTVLPKVGDVYSVTTESGSEYTVDARTDRCTCPDYKHNLPTDDGRQRCKHAARVAYATGGRLVPAWVDTDAVDPDLGAHVHATPRVAVTDGGIVEAGDDGEILTDADDATGDDGRPDECDCWDADAELPCWPCYREGFNIPNPSAGEE